MDSNFTLDTNTMIMIFAGVLLVIFIIYVLKSDSQPKEHLTPIAQVAVAPLDLVDNRKPSDPNDNTVNYLASRSTDSGSMGTFSDQNDYNLFEEAKRKKQINLRKMEHPFDADKADPREFVYKKQKFILEDKTDIEDQFDVDKLLPQEQREDWFDTTPLQSTKQIRGTDLIHPKNHMGVNSVGSSLKNGTHDIRGDIPNPKMNVSIWNNSTIEPDTNIKGICSPI